MSYPRMSETSNPEPKPESDLLGDNHSFDDEPKRKMPKSLKWLAGSALGLVLIVTGGGLIATQFIDQDYYKSLIISQVQEKTGYTVDWSGNISLGLFPLPQATVNQLTVKAGDVSVLAVDKLSVQVALMPLLSKKVDIQSISIDKPVINLITEKNGRQTWMAKPTQTDTSNQEAASAESSSSDSMSINVQKVTISDGRLIIDNQQKGSRQTLESIDSTVRAETLKGPFDIELLAMWSGQKITLEATTSELDVSQGLYPVRIQLGLPDANSQVSFSGSINPNQKSATGDINVESANLADVISLMQTEKSAPSDVLNNKFLLAGKVNSAATSISLDDMALSLGKLAYTGTIDAKGLGEGQKPDISFDIHAKEGIDKSGNTMMRVLSDLSANGQVKVDGDSIEMNKLSVKTLGNNVSVTGKVNTGVAPTVDLTVQAQTIDLDKLSSAEGSVDNVAIANASASEKVANKKDFGFTLPFSGRIKADVESLKTGGKTYQSIKADIVSHGKGLTIDGLSLNLPQNIASVSVNGKIGNTQDLSGLSLKATIKTDDVEKLASTYQVTMPDLPRKIGAMTMTHQISGDIQAIGFDSTISALQFAIGGKGQVITPLGTPSINSLAFSVRHPNFNDALKSLQKGFSGSSGFEGGLDLSGNLNWQTKDIELRDLSGKLGQTTVAGSISVRTEKKPEISGKLDLGSVILPSTSNTGGTVSAQTPNSASAQAGGRWSKENIDMTWLNNFNADLAITAKSINQNLWRLTNAKLDFNLQDGVLTLNDVSADLFGERASINGKIIAGGTSASPVSITTNLKANSVDAQGLLSAATGKPNYTLSGQLSAVDLSVNTTGQSMFLLVNNLGGQGKVSGNNIIVKGVDAAKLAETAKGSFKPLERAGSLFQSFQSGQTEFDTFESDFVIDKGVVQFSKIDFDGPKASLNSKGSVNLPQWTINLNNTMTVKGTDIPPFDFSIRGPLDKPINSGGDIINNYLQKKLEKKAAKFIEDKLGDKLNKFLGVPEGTGGQQPAPSNPDNSQQNTPTQPQSNLQDEAAKEAVKALQGLFGQ